MMSDFTKGLIGTRKRSVESSCLFTNQECALSKFQIASSDFLNDIAERSACPRCHKSRRYFCYTCYVPVDEVKDKIPRLKLPIKVDIIKHPREVEGKSTSAHAAILAPDDVRVFIYPDIPDYSKEKVLLVFPGKNALTLKDWWKSYSKNESFCYLQDKEMQRTCTCHSDCNVLSNCDGEYSQSSTCDKLQPLKSSSQPNGGSDLCNNLPDNIDDTKTIKGHCCATAARKDSSENISNEHKLSSACCSKLQKKERFLYPFERAVFIDSTWKQTKRIYGDERIRRLPSVVLTSHTSLFWRHQRAKPVNHLATIEAVYYFLVDLQNLAHPDVPYSGQYDNLLFFFKFMYHKIRRLYDPKTLRAYSDQGLDDHFQDDLL